MAVPFCYLKQCTEGLVERFALKAGDLQRIL